jgi:hypothetical protein
LLSVWCIQRDEDIQTEIHGRFLRTGGVDAGTAIYDRRHGGGLDGSDSSWRFEETVRAYRGLLTVKTLQGVITSRLEFWTRWTGRSV